MKLCSGCVIPPTEEFIEDFFRKCHVAIEWHSSLIEEEYNSKANEVLHHSSVALKEEKEDNFINMEDCLRKFQEPELLDENIYCGGCKDHRKHSKQIEIWRPPPILIVQLKRFKITNNFR